jgi:hypothetical protein
MHASDIVGIHSVFIQPTWRLSCSTWNAFRRLLNLNTGDICYTRRSSLLYNSGLLICNGIIGARENF